ncbi:hypothetical protein HK101_004928 [Irineochytrium annulatum]|nr:hypothetical protein HK101_004928 [Irineochytrium annulatum]
MPNGATDLHLEEERRICALLDGFFTPANLLMDVYLDSKLKIGSSPEAAVVGGPDAGETGPGWVPIELFAAAQRMGMLADDDAVVAKAVRQNSKRLQVSVDGKRIRMKENVAEEDRGPSIDSERSLYMEHLPPKSTEESIKTSISHLAPVDAVFFPAHVAVERAQSTTKPSPAYAFVQFETAKDMQPLLAENRKRWISFKVGNDPTSLFGSITPSQGSEWRSRTEEYIRLHAARHEELAAVLKSKKDTRTQAKREKGVVCRFTGANKKTDASVLKKLFEMVAPVSFVDYKHGNSDGHVRFKTAAGATLARLYFSREYIIQNDKHDQGTLVTKAGARRLRMEKKAARPEWHDWNEVSSGDELEAGIRLFLLQGQEESAYWKKVYSLRSEKQERLEKEAAGDVAAEFEAGAKFISPSARVPVPDSKPASIAPHVLPSRPKDSAPVAAWPAKAHIHFEDDVDDMDVGDSVAHSVENGSVTVGIGDEKVAVQTAAMAKAEYLKAKQAARKKRQRQKKQGPARDALEAVDDGLDDEAGVHAKRNGKRADPEGGEGRRKRKVDAMVAESGLGEEAFGGKWSKTSGGPVGNGPAANGKANGDAGADESGEAEEVDAGKVDQQDGAGAAVTPKESSKAKRARKRKGRVTDGRMDANGPLAVSIGEDDNTGHSAVGPKQGKKRRREDTGEGSAEGGSQEKAGAGGKRRRKAQKQ